MLKMLTRPAFWIGFLIGAFVTLAVTSVSEDDLIDCIEMEECPGWELE
jgi:hypothetical protein